MINYYKEVLVKVVSFPDVFFKELENAGKWLCGEEVEALAKWCLDTFPQYFSDRHTQTVQLDSI